MTTQGKIVLIGLGVVGLILIGFMASEAINGEKSIYAQGYNYGQQSSELMCADFEVTDLDKIAVALEIGKLLKAIPDVVTEDLEFSKGQVEGMSDYMDGLTPAEQSFCFN